MAQLRPIVKTSVVDSAYAAMRDQILFGDIAPGERLPAESALATALGVGRSTVREALNRLASARLIRIHHGGAKVVLDYRKHVGLEMVSSLVQRPDGTVDTAVARSVIQARLAIGVDAAGLACGGRDEERQTVLERATEMHGTDLDVLTERSLEFWGSLLDASHNIAYRLALNSVRTTSAGDVSLFRQLLAPELLAADRYEALGRAVVLGDETGARDAARALLQLGNTSLLAAIAAVESP